MDGSSALSASERTLLAELDRLGVRFLVVGMSAALLQGARGATEDIDLWLESTEDARLSEAAHVAGGFWMSGFGMRPPGFGGESLGDRIDVVTHMHGLETFQEEYPRSIAIELEGLRLRVLSLDRIIASKRATGRPKDQAQIPALEEALVAKSDV